MDANPYEVIFVELPKVVGSDDYSDICNILAELRQKANNYLSWISQRAVEKTIETFDKKAKQDLHHTMIEWYEHQSDFAKHGLHSSQVTGLMTCIAENSSYDDVEFVKRIIRAVTDIHLDTWNEASLEEYISMLKAVKEEIENLGQVASNNGKNELSFVGKNGEPISMLVKSLRYKNFRQFKGENTIEFSCDKKNNVTIILGNNTFGKTTLLQMFNWCFYNKAIFRKEDNPDFLLNLELSAEMYNGDEPQEVIVEITIIHEGKEYTISRKQEYIKVNGVVAPRDSRLKVWYKELETGKTVPIEKTKDMEAIINLILPEDLSGYFFFDTERVQNVAGRKDLSSSVKGLLGLNVLDNAIKHLGKDSTPSTVIGSFYKDLAENDDSKATDALEKIQAAEEKITYQTQVKEEAESEIDHYEERKTALEDKIRSLEDTTELQKRKDNLARNVKQEKDALEKAYSDYKILYGDDAVWFFAQPLYTQAMKFLTEAKVDDKGIKDVTADTIKELIQKGKCLCGAEIKDGNDAYLHLMEQIKFVPPESIGTTINNFKKSIRSFDKVNNNDRYFMTIQTKIGEILRCKNRISEWEDEIKDIEAEIEGKEDAKKYQIELNDVKKRLKEQTSKKENAIAKIAEAESEKSRFKKIYDQLIAKSDKGREIRRYIAYAVKIQEWLQEYYNNEESMIRKQLEDRVNAIFTRMYHGERILQINEKYQSVLYTKIKGSDELIISGESEGLIRVKNFAFIAGLVDLAKEKALRGIPLLVQRYKKIMLELGAHMYIIKTIKGDITKPLGVQAIVNAANSSLLGGGGVDGAIHRAAGPELLFECRLLGGCKTGQAKLTKAYNLPCDYIIHTVGPVWNGGKKNEEELLASCYYNAMQVAMDNEIRTIAFPSISTGIYHFPVELAAKIAVATVARFLSVNEDKFDLVEWVLFDENTEKVYENEVDKIYRDMK